MRSKRLDIDPANVNTTGYDSGLTGAGPWTITTQNSGDSLAHRVGVGSSSTTIAAIVLTLTGTDADGKAITNTVTGINNSTVETTKYFKTLTTISASATIGASTLDVGWVDEVTSQTIPLDHYQSSPPVIQIDLTGTANFDIEVTAENPYPNLTDENGAPFAVAEQSDLTWINDGNFTAKTADLIDDLAVEGVRALRVVINSYTDTAELQVHINQPY